ncbi:hypothetical protein JCM17823_09670 [Halorubrum gandharaense]
MRAHVPVGPNTNVDSARGRAAESADRSPNAHPRTLTEHAGADPIDTLVDRRATHERLLWRVPPSAHCGARRTREGGGSTPASGAVPPACSPPRLGRAEVRLLCGAGVGLKGAAGSGKTADASTQKAGRCGEAF